MISGFEVQESSKFTISHLPRISQPRRNPMNGRRKCIIELRCVFSPSFPSKQLDLNQTHRIYVWITQPNGARQHSIVLKKLSLVCNAQHGGLRTFEFFANQAEHAIPQTGI